MALFYKPSGCVLDFEFAELQGDKVIDLSGNGNDGTIYGATWKRGPLLGALYFDGVNDYVEVPDSSLLQITGDITIELLFKMHSILDTYTGLIAKRKDKSTTCTFGFSVKTSNTLFYHGDGTDYDLLEGSPVEVDKWVFVHLIRNGGNMYIYLNGKQDASMAISHTPDPATGYPAVIGATTSSEEFSNGIIAFVRIYNRALTDDEIKAHYYYLISHAQQKIPSKYVHKTLVRRI